jgi:hypothetical protein
MHESNSYAGSTCYIGELVCENRAFESLKEDFYECGRCRRKRLCLEVRVVRSILLTHGGHSGAEATYIFFQEWVDCAFPLQSKLQGGDCEETWNSRTTNSRLA